MSELRKTQQNVVIKPAEGSVRRGRETRQYGDGESPLDLLNRRTAQSEEDRNNAIHGRDTRQSCGATPKLSEKDKEEARELERRLMLSRLKDELEVSMERSRRVEELSGQIPRQEYTRGLSLSPTRPSNNSAKAARAHYQRQKAGHPGGGARSAGHSASPTKRGGRIEMLGGAGEPPFLFPAANPNGVNNGSPNRALAFGDANSAG